MGVVCRAIASVVFWLEMGFAVCGRHAGMDLVMLCSHRVVCFVQADRFRVLGATVGNAFGYTGFSPRRVFCACKYVSRPLRDSRQCIWFCCLFTASCVLCRLICFSSSARQSAIHLVCLSFTSDVSADQDSLSRVPRPTISNSRCFSRIHNYR